MFQLKILRAFMVKTEVNVWENSRNDQWKPEIQSRSRFWSNLTKVVDESTEKLKQQVAIDNETINEKAV